jgi:hypothetical protein
VVERPLGVVAVLFACVLYMGVMLWRTYDDPAGADQGLNAVIGHGLVNGRLLYADVWDQKPPGVYVAYAAAELVVGYGPPQFYVLNLAGWIVTLLGLFLAGKLLAGPRAGLCAGLLWAVLVVQDEWFTQPNAEVFMNAGLVWSYYLILRLNAAPGWWLASAFGAAAGIASLFKPTAFVPAGLIGLAYIIGSRQQQGGFWLALRHMVAAAGVSMAIWVGWIAWFWSQGSLADFYDAVVVHTRHYSGNLVQNLAGLFQSHRRYLLAVLISCVAVPYVAKAQGSPVQRSGWLALAGWAAGCAIAIALPGQWYHHYYQLWMPIYALVGGALLSVPFAGPFVKRSAARVALLATVLVPLVLAHQRRPSLDTGRFAINRIEARLTGLAIDRELFPHETVYVFGYLGQTSGVYFASRRSPPSGVIFDYPLQGGPLAGRLEERILRDLDRAPPDMIVLTRLSFLPGPKLKSLYFGKPAVWGERLVDWISQHYVQRGFPASTKYAYYARRGSSLERRLPERSDSDDSSLSIQATDNRIVVRHSP